MGGSPEPREVEARVCCDRTTALQPGRQSEIPSERKKKRRIDVLNMGKDNIEVFKVTEFIFCISFCLLVKSIHLPHSSSSSLIKKGTKELLICELIMIKKKNNQGLGTVAHTCNPSTLVG